MFITNLGLTGDHSLLKLSILVEVCSEYFIFCSSRFLVPIGSWAPWASCHFCLSALGLRSSCYGLFWGSGGATAVSPGWADGTAEAGIQTSRDNGASLGFSVAGTEDLLPDSLSASAGLWGSGRHDISILVNVLFSLVGEGGVQWVWAPKVRSSLSGPCNEALSCWSCGSLLVWRGENLGRLSITSSMPYLHTTQSCPTQSSPAWSKNPSQSTDAWVQLKWAEVPSYGQHR